MSISSIIITLADHETRRAAAFSQLAHLPFLTLGPLVEGKLPAVLDTPSPYEDTAAIDQLCQIDGVLQVDLVLVYLTATEEQPRS